MSTLVDIPENEIGDMDGLENDLETAAAASAELEKLEAIAVAEEAAKAVPDIDPRYQGKSVADVIAMHQNAEAKIGELGNDVGHYRKLTDQLLDVKRLEDLQKGGVEAEAQGFNIPEITSTELLDNPTEALRRAAEAAYQQGVDASNKRMDTIEASLVERDFTQKHPDAGTIANDPKFLEWVKVSPTRVRAAQAAYNKDWGVADDLLSEWKSLPSAVEKVISQPAATPASQRNDTNLQAAKRASTETKGSSTPVDAPSGKIYRRSDLIQLKLSKPAVYEDPQFQAEIIQAYREGRVK